MSHPGPLLSNFRRYLWRKKHCPFGKEFTVFEGPTIDSNSGYFNFTGSRQRDVPRWTNVGGPIPTCGRPIYSSLQVTISRVNNQGVVKSIRRIFYFPTNPDAKGSDEPDGEEVEVVNNSIGKLSSASSTKPPSKTFHSQVISRNPRNFRPVLSTIASSNTPTSLNPYPARPALPPPMRPSPIPQPRK
ncbi:hypothetical protein O181_016961 [Austropuccinia psidii MF-1]|uniref:Uncharacterized protein n=1 Tax=Austropuccinia psidii MF-1 TaxID=1389203 RepID=A0A9Q3C6Q3_9BASI|nr:hypothetical protein [Austropuccinia psidii MF-1]